jgi:hypothetical protein
MENPKKYGGNFAFLGRAGLGFDSKDGFVRSPCRAGSSPDQSVRGVLGSRTQAIVEMEDPSSARGIIEILP